MKRIGRTLVAMVVLAGLTFGGSLHAAPADEALAPVSEGEWLGKVVATCSDETGTTDDYSCAFSGQAPSDFPAASYCIETPSGLAVSLECTASLTANTVGKLGKAGCLTTPPPNQLTTTNGTVSIFSTATQQSYEVPVKVWVTRGVGKFAGVGNYALTVMKVTGGFSTTCGVLERRGVFKGEFTLAAAER